MSHSHLLKSFWKQVKYTFRHSVCPNTALFFKVSKTRDNFTELDPRPLIYATSYSSKLKTLKKNGSCSQFILNLKALKLHWLSKWMVLFVWYCVRADQLCSCMQLNLQCGKLALYASNSICMQCIFINIQFCRTTVEIQYLNPNFVESNRNGIELKPVPNIKLLKQMKILFKQK